VSPTVSYQFHIDRTGPRIVLRDGLAPTPPPVGNIPRIAKLMALAHRFDGLIQSGAVGSMAGLAAERGISRARMSQIMALLLLAPDLQEQLLFLPKTVRGRDPITLRALRPVCATPIWEEQRERWARNSEASRVIY
jgi:hypothetical protein